MSFSVAYLCGPGMPGRVVTVACDKPECRAAVAYSTVEQYNAAAAAGWRKGPGKPPAWFACPAHSGALAAPMR